MNCSLNFLLLNTISSFLSVAKIKENLFKKRLFSQPPNFSNQKLSSHIQKVTFWYKISCENFKNNLNN